MTAPHLLLEQTGGAQRAGKMQLVRRTGRTLALMAVVAAVTGCSLLPERLRPTLTLPAPTASAADYGDLERWWLRFNDAELNSLVEQALHNNTDLVIAAARIDEAAEQIRIANQRLLPSLDLDVAATRNRRSERTSTSFPGLPVYTDNRQIGLSATYELDLWGRIRQAERSAVLRLQAETWARRAAGASIAAQVAQSVFLVRTLSQQRGLTADTLQLADEAIALLERQRDAGLIGDFELLQNRAERDAFAVRLTDLDEALGRARRALAVLCGAQPATIIGFDVGVEALPTQPEVPEGLPSTLLLQRPDVMQGEARLAAASADIAAARAAWFPQLSLTGRYGYQSREFGELIGGPATVWSLGLSLLQPIIGARETAARVRSAEARQRQNEAAYIGTVQRAFAETGDALDARRAAREARLLQERRQQELADTLRMAQRRFDAGLTGALEVIDARRSLLAAQLDALDRRNAELGATVDLFRALGGGWSQTEPAHR